MNDQEKSALLAKAMGWEFSYWPIYNAPDVAIIDPPEGVAGDGFESFYSPSNMALAWRVHLWQIKQEERVESVDWPYQSWFDIVKPWLYEDAQRRWLDKIVELLDAN